MFALWLLEDPERSAFDGHLDDPRTNKNNKSKLDKLDNSGL